MDNKANGSGRRHFLGGTFALVSGLVLISAGSAVTIFRFIFGGRSGNSQDLESERLRLMAQNTQLGELEMERQMHDQILVGRLADLDAAKGKYFTDFEMQQALAFLDKDNLPILLSAKCTHLGCTVGANVDDQGRVLCPCHISYFNINTGAPSAGSPAKKPLPHLSWVVKDDSGKVVAKKIGDGAIEGSQKLQDLDKLSVFVVKDSKRDV